jgi:hypothetical protein
MPKKKRQETEAEQTQWFRLKVKELIDAGELSPTEADAAFERLMTKVRTPKE